jgi:ligand-binding sensor domain-containing protein
MRLKFRSPSTTIFGVAALTILTRPADALDTRQPAGSYLRTAVTVEGPSNVVNDVLQTWDGFLMVGTAQGLVRFDGRHFVVITLLPDPTREVVVQSLAEAPNGDLWVGTEFGISRIPGAVDNSGILSKLSRFQEGRFHNYTTADGLSANGVGNLYQDRAGAIWAATRLGIDRLAGDRFVEALPSQDGRAMRVLGEDALGGMYLVLAQLGLSTFDAGLPLRKTIVRRFKTLRVAGHGRLHILKEDHS